jgi:lysylphosphatidylglycerol synthetase-like protein (DUF2156 family)
MPPTRVQITILALTALYLGGVWAIESDSTQATTVRTRVGGIWSRHVAPGEGGWVARNAGLLRIAGIAAAIACVVLLPSLSFGNIVAIVALALVYLAAIDLLANRRQESREDT